MGKTTSLPKLGTPERETLDAEIVQAYGSGLSERAVAGKFAVSETTVRRAIKRAGVGRGRRVVAAIDGQEVRSRYEGGATLDELAGRYEPCKGTLRRVLEEAGATIRSPAGNGRAVPLPARGTDERAKWDRAVAAAYDQGLSLAQVARKFGVSGTTVGRTVESRPHVRELSRSEVQAAKRGYAKGASIRVLAELNQVGEWRMRKILESADVVIRARGRVRKEKA